jgi:hypothetical protein
MSLKGILFDMVRFHEVGNPAVLRQQAA